MPEALDARELLERHLPVLRYDSQGSFMADSPAIMTDRVSQAGRGNELKRADGTVLASAGAAGNEQLRLELLGWPRYTDDTRAARSDYIDALGRDYVAQAREMHRGELADRIHGHAVPDEEGGGWWLQYWLFYLFNNKAFLGFGLHEGDWEMVQVRIGPGGRPRAMAFAQHSHGQRCGWDLVEARGERPIVYVARGSQASFASAGSHDAPVVADQADGKGPEVADATLDVIGDDDPPWVAWPGRWGSTKARHKLESNSPRGPAHQDKWGDPATFHEECDEIRRRRGPEPVVPGPPAPEITVRREGERALISYRFPAAVAGPEPAWLILTLDSLADELPPYTDTVPVDAPSGEVVHPLQLEDGSYRVLASAADAQGNVSEQVTTILE